MDMTQETKSVASSSGRLFVALLVAFFTVPVVIVVALSATSWKPGSYANHGDLVQPPRPIRDAALRTVDDRVVRFSDFRNKWTLLYFGPAECPSQCLQSLYKMRQVHLAVGKEMERVQRVFVATGISGAGGLGQRLKDYPGMTAMVGPAESISALARQFTLPADLPGAGPQRIYLVDPLGNLVLSYPADGDPRGMLKDLMRLLQYSWVG